MGSVVFAMNHGSAAVQLAAGHAQGDEDGPRDSRARLKAAGKLQLPTSRPRPAQPPCMFEVPCFGTAALRCGVLRCAVARQDWLTGAGRVGKQAKRAVSMKRSVMEAQAQVRQLNEQLEE